MSPLKNGTQPPPSNAQTNVPTVDPTSVETLLTQATHINTSLVTAVPPSDVSLAPRDYNSTRNGTPVFSTEFTRPSHLTKLFSTWRHPKNDKHNFFNIFYFLCFVLLNSSFVVTFSLFSIMLILNCKWLFIRKRI